MMQGYVNQGYTPDTTFSLFFRSLSKDWGDLVGAGLEQVLAAVEEPRRSCSTRGFQSLVATKAVRMRDVVERYGDGQTLVDFGSHRGHGVDVNAARAAYVGAGFGPGTALTTSEDAPALDIVYRLLAVERDGGMRPSMELSSGKVTYTGGKRVGRVERGGSFVRDVIGRRDEDAGGRDPFETVVVDGDVVSDRPSLDAIRAVTQRNVRALPDGVRAVENPEGYEVSVSDALVAETDALRERLESRAA
jgi:nicotinic acid phosphoribosyltransferase